HGAVRRRRAYEFERAAGGMATKFSSCPPVRRSLGEGGFMVKYSGVAVFASLRALLEQAIDYAGMFPPCAFALEPALRNQASYVRSPEAWMLNGFVLAVGQFDAAAQFLSEFDSQHALRVAALGPKTTSADGFLDGVANAAAAIHSLSRYDTN